MNPRAVLDTNVLVAALRSRQGASFALLSRLPKQQFQPVVSVPLMMEYADVLSRPGRVPVSASAVEAVLDMVCRESLHQPIHFLWRPQLRDPKDDMVLEAAVNAQARYLVTHNLKDFAQGRFAGLAIVTPGQFLNLLDGVHP
ncbi:MAG: putative toxin-antitoxin system toxin component, PIN family [Acidovorax sp.]|uniref:putative toxin-antitoxin system toxin component, PIN family n=1 Tax=Acidovorax sp. TaxID=1872122 RepID=UPI0039E524E1